MLYAMYMVLLFTWFSYVLCYLHGSSYIIAVLSFQKLYWLWPLELGFSPVGNCANEWGIHQTINKICIFTTPHLVSVHHYVSSGAHSSPCTTCRALFVIFLVATFLIILFFSARDDWTLPWWIQHHIQACEARKARYWCHPFIKIHPSQVNCYLCTKKERK
jgi:hypothetical protein